MRTSIIKKLSGYIEPLILNINNIHKQRILKYTKTRSVAKSHRTAKFFGLLELFTEAKIIRRMEPFLVYSMVPESNTNSE
jgi:hypothetical protein